MQQHLLPHFSLNTFADVTAFVLPAILLTFAGIAGAVAAFTLPIVPEHQS